MGVHELADLDREKVLEVRTEMANDASIATRIEVLGSCALVESGS